VNTVLRTICTVKPKGSDCVYRVATPLPRGARRPDVDYNKMFATPHYHEYLFLVGRGAVQVRP
jgi:hypothetical protein